MRFPLKAKQYIVWEVDDKEVNRKEIRYIEIDGNGIFKGDLILAPKDWKKKAKK